MPLAWGRAGQEAVCVQRQCIHSFVRQRGKGLFCARPMKPHPAYRPQAMLPARLPASETPVHAAAVPQRQISAQSAAIIEVLVHAEIPCAQGDKAFI
jgi:hypothetical protein